MTNTPTPAQALGEVIHHRSANDFAGPMVWHDIDDNEWSLSQREFIACCVNLAVQHGQHFAGLEAEVERLRTERRMAPVQGYAAGIPWSMHLEAYDVYCKRHGKQQALIEGGCRGGFGVGELDQFIPGWRERVSEITQLRERAEAAAARCAELEARLANAEKHLDDSRDTIKYAASRLRYLGKSTCELDGMEDRIAAFLAANVETK